jgi:hypothetical protein
VAALLMTTLLFFVMVLGVAYSHRELIIEQRTAANQLRSMQAFEAAEAGLEWVVARINDNRRIDAACHPLASGATSLRDRWLRFDAARRTHLPVTWWDGSADVPTQAACARGPHGWTCHCPIDAPAVAPGAPAPAAAAFRVHAVAGDRPGVVRVVSAGCIGVADACHGTPDELGATARLEVTLGLLPGLRSLPAAALTVRGDIGAGTATFSAHNGDPATGLALHAGGSIDAPLAALRGPPGGALATLALSGDGTLAALSRERLFAALFGSERSSWLARPGVVELACGLDCAGTLSRTLGSAGSNALLHVTGDASIVGPVTLGSPAAPVLIVVSGALTLTGAVVFHGAVHADTLTWTGSGGAIHGFAVADAGYAGTGSPAFVYEPATLARLRGSGAFARVSGSWRDF